jgi:GNAT superfamily N-acetyltransferase
MSTVTIRDMRPDDEYFVSTCSHVHESEEIDACAEQRRKQFAIMKTEGSVFKVATLGDQCAGFAYGVPIEHSSWGPLGNDWMVIPCLFVLGHAKSRGIGRALIESIEGEARAAGYQGVTITACRDLPGAEWFMPAAYFESLDYTPVATRGREVLLGKPFASDTKPPRFLNPHYAFEPVEGVVAVDLFWNAFCETSVIEAQRVREVCSEFGDRVLLREFRAEDRDILLKYQLPRGIYVNGREIGWGYEAPRDGIRDAIRQALGDISNTE